MYSLPTTIQIGGIELSIRNNGDYRMVLDAFSALNDEELNKEERIYCALIIFYSDFDSVDDVNEFPYLEDAIQEMFNFFNAGIPESNKKSPKLIDWEGDEGIIMPAINNVAKQEVRLLDYLHWWTFMGYYMSIGESTMSTVVSIRDKVVKGKKLEKWEREYKSSNPQYFNWNHKSADDLEAEQWLKEVWNKE